MLKGAVTDKKILLFLRSARNPHNVKYVKYKGSLLPQNRVEYRETGEIRVYSLNIWHNGKNKIKIQSPHSSQSHFSKVIVFLVAW